MSHISIKLGIRAWHYKPGDKIMLREDIVPGDEPTIVTLLNGRATLLQPQVGQLQHCFQGPADRMGEEPQDREESWETLCPGCDMAVVPITPQQLCLLA